LRLIEQDCLYAGEHSAPRAIWKPAVCCATEPAGSIGSGSEIDPKEGVMSAGLQFLEEWIPERMDPGTIFVLANQTKMGSAQNPFVALMSCPRCGTMGLITRRQLVCGDPLICGGDLCSAEYSIDGEIILYRPVQ
jgi:hypothetical protein